MALFKRKTKQPKTFDIAGEDYYTIVVAAEILGFSRSKLNDGLNSRRFNFRYAKMPDSGKIYVLASDVNVYRRSRDWVHLARTETLTHLAVHRKRGRAAFDEIGIINRFEGVLVRDGWQPYERYEQCRHSLCNAHLLRKLTFVSENEPAHREWTNALAKLLVRINVSVDRAKANSETILNQSRQSYFSERYDKILTAAARLIRGSPKRKDIVMSAHNLLNRFLTNKPAILRFMTNFSVPFDNNGSERDLRMLKLQQKISGCFRSMEGVKTFCRVRTFLSSARKQSVNLLIALESALKGKPIILNQLFLIGSEYQRY